MGIQMFYITEDISLVLRYLYQFCVSQNEVRQKIVKIVKISQISAEENCGTISVVLTVGIVPRVEAGSGTILSKLATTPILGKCRPIKGWRGGGGQEKSSSGNCQDRKG